MGGDPSVTIDGRRRSISDAIAEANLSEHASSGLEDRLEALRQTLGDAAHTFNNLFAITLGRAEMLLEGGADDLLKRECVESIRRAAIQGRDLVHQLRQATRPSADR